MFDKMKPNDKQKIINNQLVSHIEIYSKLYNEDAYNEIFKNKKRQS